MTRFSIRCKCCKKEIASFYITHNLNKIFPFRMLYYHDYKHKKRFIKNTIMRTLKYYLPLHRIYDLIWNFKSYKHIIHEFPAVDDVWMTTYPNAIAHLILYYWHFITYPPDKYEWSCGY